MPLFIVLRDGATSTTTSRAIRARIREDCSPRHVPDEITSDRRGAADALGKVLEVPVKRILMGAPAEAAAGNHWRTPRRLIVLWR